jgi:hypothetical protein
MSANPDSILDSVKQSLGLAPEFTAFDLDVTLFTNASFCSLQQLGVGGDSGFVISDNSTLWTQYVTELLYLGMVKHYIFLYVKMAFDPPSTSFGLEAIQKMLIELGWRINVSVEHINPPSPPGEEEDGPTSDTTVTWFKVKVVNMLSAHVVTPDAGEGNTFYLTQEADDGTINAPINGVDGQHITLEIVSNGYTVNWGNGWNFGTSGLPQLSSGGKKDIISAIYRAEAAEWYAGYVPGF